MRHNAKRLHKSGAKNCSIQWQGQDFAKFIDIDNGGVTSWKQVAVGGDRRSHAPYCDSSQFWLTPTFL